jgi:hypothetical protein
MSILKSTNSGKKLYWHIQLNRLSEKIYNTVKDFPSKLLDLSMYYEVPYTQNGKLYFVRSKIRFNKGFESKDEIVHAIKQAFSNEIMMNVFEIGDNHCIEDIDISNPKMEIEKYG